MLTAKHIGPDLHLQLETADAISKEEVAAAWELAYEDLRVALESLSSEGKLYIVFGLQGSGKTTWIRENSHRLADDSVFFDGPLPSRERRTRALAMAKTAGVRAVAVWINTPLATALARNAHRLGLARIREEAILHVHSLLEAPSLAEGFSEIIEVTLCEA